MSPKLAAVVVSECHLIPVICEKSQLAGTVDGCGAVIGAELGVDAADLRADGVDRDGQFAGDLGPGQVRRQKT
jgi:hypothetical protein